MKRLIMAFTVAVATALSVHTAKAEEAVRPPIYDVLVTDANGYFKTGYVPNMRRTKIEMKVSFTKWNKELGSGYNNTLFTANNGVAGIKVKDEQATAAKGKERYRYGNAMMVELNNGGTSIDWFNRRDNIYQEGGSWKQAGIDVGPNGGYVFQKDTPYVIVARNNTLTIDGSEPFGKGPEDSENDVSASSELVLLANCNAAKGPAEGYTFGTFNSQSPKKVYYVKIYETDANGENPQLVHRYLPSKNGDVATLWDEVTGEFLTPISGGAFTVTCEHDWSEWSADTATKFTGGRRTRACMKCQTVESRQTPQLWDYLQTDNKGYFLTDYVPNLAKGFVEMQLVYLDSEQSGLFTASPMSAGQKPTGAERWVDVMSCQIQDAVDYFNSKNTGFSKITDSARYAPDVPHHYVFCGPWMSADDVEASGTQDATADKPAAGPLALLATHFGNYTAGPDKTGFVLQNQRKVYFINLGEVDGDETHLARKYRPAMDANGNATLYDEVTGTYLTVKGGGIFSVGNDTEPEEPTIDEDPDWEPETAYDAEHTIVCYGDSLTEGDYAEQITFGGRENFFDGRLEGVTAEAGYPWWLANRIPTEYNVIAQARSGMCVDYMLGWQGGLKVRLSGPVTLPAEADTPVAMPSALIFDGAYKYAPNGWKWELSHTDPAKGDKWLGCGTPILPSTDTKDKCVCDSITGVLTGWICGKRVRLQSSHNGDMTISRVVAGDRPLTLPAGATFTPDTAKLWPGHIHVILGGANDGVGQIDQYIADIKAAFAGVEKYVVVSPHCSWQASYATKFEAAFGEHYLNLYDAMSTRGLAKAAAIGDPATTTDWRAADGSGLLAGSVDSYTHFNTRGYKVLAAFVEEKLVELGYLPGHQHSWSEWENDTATDWEDGTQTRTCTDPECGKTEERFSPQHYKCLTVDASGYFDTGLHPNLAKAYIAFDVEFAPWRLNTGKIQGLMVANGGNALNINLEKTGASRGLSTVWDIDYYNNPANEGTIDPAQQHLYPAYGNEAGRHQIVVKGMSMSIDGEDVADHSQDALRDAPSTDTLKLLTTYSGGKQCTRYGTAGNIYSIQIGEVVGDSVVITHSYRPAKNGNQATLWDEVTGEFLTPLQISNVDSDGKAVHTPFQFSLVSAREAGARTWTGAAGDNKWETNENWDPQGVPEATEDVTLDSSIGNITALPGALLPTGKRTITLKTDGEHNITIKNNNFAFDQQAYESLTLDVATKPGANGWLDLGSNGLNMKYGVVRANLDGNRLKFNYFYDYTPGSEFIIDNGASFVAGDVAELGNQTTKMTLKGDSFMNCGTLITLKNKFQLTLVPTPDGVKNEPYLKGEKYVIDSGLNVTVDVSAFAKQHVTRTYTFMKSDSDSTIDLPTATIVGEGAKNCTVTFEKSSDNKTILMTVKSAPKGFAVIIR